MRKQILFIVFTAVYTAGVFAMSLDEAVSLAVKNNISIKRQEISLEAAQRSSRHSWNTLLPSFSVSANDEFSFPDIVKSGKEPVQEGITNSFGAEGRISLSISSDCFASIKKSKLDYEAARISYDQAVSEIISQVKEAYFSLIYEKQNLDYLRENLENAKKQAEQNAERFKKGTLSELEYLSSKVACEKLKPELKAQELEYQNHIKNFRLLLGVEESDAENMPVPEGFLENYIKNYECFFDETMKTAISADVHNGDIPSVQNLKKQLEASKTEVSKTKLSVWGPSASLSYSVNPVFAGEEQGRIKQSASVGLSLPLENYLPFSQGSDAIKLAEDSVNDLQLQLTDKLNNLKVEFSSIYDALEQKNQSVKSLREFVMLAQKTYEAAQYSYSKGTMDLLSMQNAAKDNLEAKLNLQNEFLETLKLYISLENLCGKSAVLVCR